VVWCDGEGPTWTLALHCCAPVWLPLEVLQGPGCDGNCGGCCRLDTWTDRLSKTKPGSAAVATGGWRVPLGTQCCKQTGVDMHTSCCGKWTVLHAVLAHAPCNTLPRPACAEFCCKVVMAELPPPCMSAWVVWKRDFARLPARSSLSLLCVARVAVNNILHVGTLQQHCLVRKAQAHTSVHGRWAAAGWLQGRGGVGQAGGCFSRSAHMACMHASRATGRS
jgi:hypothetical protein